MLPEFDLLMPQSLPEAIELLASHGPGTAPIAGGTNLVVDMRAERHCPQVVMNIANLNELRGIRRENGHIVIGGGTTIAELLRNPLIAEYASPLKEAAAVFANPLTRNRATVGGNLVDASPAADTAPPLLALGAEVELASRTGTRCVPLENFMVGVRKTLLRPDELLVAVRWPVVSQRGAGAFYKLGLRKADAISVVSVAVMIEADENGRCESARIALGAVAPKPFRAYEAEMALQGQSLTPNVIEEAARLSAEATRPIDDIRGSAAYRKRVTGVIVRRLLTHAAERL